MRVRTNRQPREFLEAPTAQDRAEFDYLPPEEDSGFFCFRGNVYHISQFERISDPYWTGAFVTSMTTGVLVRILSDGRIIVGTFCA